MSHSILYTPDLIQILIHATAQYSTCTGLKSIVPCLCWIGTVYWMMTQKLYWPVPSFYNWYRTIPFLYWFFYCITNNTASTILFNTSYTVSSIIITVNGLYRNVMQNSIVWYCYDTVYSQYGTGTISVFTWTAATECLLGYTCMCSCGTALSVIRLFLKTQIMIKCRR